MQTGSGPRTHRPTAAGSAPTVDLAMAAAGALCSSPPWEPSLLQAASELGALPSEMRVEPKDPSGPDEPDPRDDSYSLTLSRPDAPALFHHRRRSTGGEVGSSDGERADELPCSCPWCRRRAWFMADASRSSPLSACAGTGTRLRPNQRRRPWAGARLRPNRRPRPWAGARLRPKSTTTATGGSSAPTESTATAMGGSLAPTKSMAMA